MHQTPALLLMASLIHPIMLNAFASVYSPMSTGIQPLKILEDILVKVWHLYILIFRCEGWVGHMCDNGEVPPLCRGGGDGLIHYFPLLTISQSHSQSILIWLIKYLFFIYLVHN